MTQKNYNEFMNFFKGIVTLMIALYIMSALCKCNPLSEQKTPITLYICLAPTIKIEAEIISEKINQDTLDKYFDFDENLYSVRVDTLVISQYGCKVSVHAACGAVTLDETYFLFKQKFPDINKAGVLIRIKLED